MRFWLAVLLVGMAALLTALPGVSPSVSVAAGRLSVSAYAGPPMRLFLPRVEPVAPTPRPTATPAPTPDPNQPIGPPAQALRARTLRYQDAIEVTWTDPFTNGGGYYELLWCVGSANALCNVDDATRHSRFRIGGQHWQTFSAYENAVPWNAYACFWLMYETTTGVRSGPYPTARQGTVTNCANPSR